MKSAYGLAGLALLGLSMTFWGVASQAQQDPPPDGVAAKAGETLDEVGRAIKRGLVDAEESLRDGLNKTGVTVREGFAKTRDSVQGMGLIPRVYGRLHWDKALYSCNLLVKAEGGTVTIRGMVPDEAAKAHAISLVKDTVGVTSVVVQLTVVSPSVGATSSSPKPWP
jgi:hypothetical protein